MLIEKSRTKFKTPTNTKQIQLEHVGTIWTKREQLISSRDCWKQDRTELGK